MPNYVIASGSNSILDQLTHLRAQGIYHNGGVPDSVMESLSCFEATPSIHVCVFCQLLRLEFYSTKRSKKRWKSNSLQNQDNVWNSFIWNNLHEPSIKRTAVWSTSMSSTRLNVIVLFAMWPQGDLNVDFVSLRINKKKITEK